jgi:hypothetical protein
MGQTWAKSKRGVKSLTWSDGYRLNARLRDDLGILGGLPLASAALDLTIKLFQPDGHRRIHVKLSISPQRLRNAVILVGKNGRQRPEQICGESGALGFGQLWREPLNFINRRHEQTVVARSPGSKLAKGRTAERSHAGPLTHD